MGPIHVTPGFVSGSSAKGLNEVAAQSDKVRADMERLKVARTGDFPAKLTAYDSATGYYSWTRQTFDDSMVRYDYENAAGGTTLYNPAKTCNGEVLTSFPVNVWLRPVGASSTVGVVHEVVAGPAVGGVIDGSSALSGQQSILPTTGYSLAAITLQYTGLHIIDVMATVLPESFSFASPLPFQLFLGGTVTGLTTEDVSHYGFLTAYGLMTVRETIVRTVGAGQTLILSVINNSSTDTLHLVNALAVATKLP